MHRYTDTPRCPREPRTRWDPKMHRLVQVGGTSRGGLCSAVASETIFEHMECHDRWDPVGYLEPLRAVLEPRALHVAWR